VILFALFIIHANSQELSTTPLFSVFENNLYKIEGHSLMTTAIGFQSCLCLNGGYCVESTGVCICLPQYSGTFCQIRKKL
jgi:hypothetical protein